MQFDCNSLTSSPPRLGFVIDETEAPAARESVPPAAKLSQQLVKRFDVGCLREASTGTSRKTLDALEGV